MTKRGYGLLPKIAVGTQWMQSQQPKRPVRGLTRLSNLLHRWLPPFQGVARLADGIQMELDSRDSTQRALLIMGCYQPALTHLLRQHTPIGGYCLDIGANLGFFTLAFAAWAGAQGQVAAFEANPALLEAIRHNVHLNAAEQVEVVPQAVHDTAGVLTFYVAAAAGKSSVLQSHVPQPIQTLTVDTITVDEFIESRGWPRLDVIKMDIEGNDCRALLSARQSITKYRPFVVFEYWYSTPADITEAVVRMFEDAGYTLCLLQPDGKQMPFVWQQRQNDRRNVDVVCIPGNG
jgi:FkbM family methyltransferase